MIAWFPLNNIPGFNGEFVKVLDIALIKPTFTGAAHSQVFLQLLLHLFWSSQRWKRIKDAGRRWIAEIVFSSIKRVLGEDLFF